MKVKDYIEKYLIAVDTDKQREEQANDLLYELYTDFFNMVQTRKIKKARAACSLLNEINNKWVKICESQEGKRYGLDRTSFLFLIKEAHPSLFSNYEILFPQTEV